MRTLAAALGIATLAAACRDAAAPNDVAPRPVVPGGHPVADVQNAVPPGPNEETWKFCGSFGQILFEGLSDGAVLGEIIPGVRFTTTAGQDWLVGRWSAAKYNGKYPSGAYTSEGDAWAWLGPSQGEGVITFTQGTASFFSLFASTATGVTVDAYGVGGNLLTTSGFASANISSGNMAKLTISRPTADIKSVRVHDTGNFWLIDAICTDAPGVNPSLLDVPDYKQFTAPAPWNWPAELYAATQKTISLLGCGLTSLVDLIRSYGITTVNGQDVNPSNLNKWLNDNNGYDNGNVRWWAIDTYTGNRLVYDNQSVLCDPGTAQTLYSSVVDKQLFEQRPVILRVKKGSEPCGHFVVARGKANNSYVINDPGSSKPAYSLLDAPYNGQFAGYRSYKPAPGTPRPIVVINIYSPADLLITGPDGKHAGLDPSSGKIISEIPGSSYSDDGGIESEDQPGVVTPHFRSLQISEPLNGQYQLAINGTGTGPYRVEIIARDESDAYNTQNIIGEITPGATQKVTIAYSRTNAGAASVTSTGGVSGGGNIGPAVVSASVTAAGANVTGKVLINVTAPNKQLIESVAIRSATFQPGAANISGSCTINGQTPCTFAMSALGGAQQQVTVEVRDNAGKVLYSAADVLRGQFNITAVP
jgi:hypothetical protein